MTPRLLDRARPALPRPIRDEARLRHARALLFSGDQAACRREIADWGGPAQVGDNAFLRDLADTYLRLDALPLAIEAEKIRASSPRGPARSPGSKPGTSLALACYRDPAATKDARQVVDATAILHPDLGGGELRGKFERLRQKIGQE